MDEFLRHGKNKGLLDYIEDELNNEINNEIEDLPTLESGDEEDEEVDEEGFVPVRRTKLVKKKIKKKVPATRKEKKKVKRKKKKKVKKKVEKRLPFRYPTIVGPDQMDVRQDGAVITNPIPDGAKQFKEGQMEEGENKPVGQGQEAGESQNPGSKVPKINILNLGYEAELSSEEESSSGEEESSSEESEAESSEDEDDIDYQDLYNVTMEIPDKDKSPKKKRVKKKRVKKRRKRNKTGIELDRDTFTNAQAIPATMSDDENTKTKKRRRRRKARAPKSVWIKDGEEVVKTTIDIVRKENDVVLPVTTTRARRKSSVKFEKEISGKILELQRKFDEQKAAEEKKKLENQPGLLAPRFEKRDKLKENVIAGVEGYEGDEAPQTNKRKVKKKVEPQAVQEGPREAKEGEETDSDEYTYETITEDEDDEPKKKKEVTTKDPVVQDDALKMEMTKAINLEEESETETETETETEETETESEEEEKTTKLDLGDDGAIEDYKAPDLEAEGEDGEVKDLYADAEEKVKKTKKKKKKKDKSKKKKNKGKKAEKDQAAEGEEGAIQEATTQDVEQEAEGGAKIDGGPITNDDKTQDQATLSLQGQNLTESEKNNQDQFKENPLAIQEQEKEDDEFDIYKVENTKPDSPRGPAIRHTVGASNLVIEEGSDTEMTVQEEVETEVEVQTEKEIETEIEVEVTDHEFAQEDKLQTSNTATLKKKSKKKKKRPLEAFEMQDNDLSQSLINSKRRSHAEQICTLKDRNDIRKYIIKNRGLNNPIVKSVEVDEILFRNVRQTPFKDLNGMQRFLSILYLPIWLLTTLTVLPTSSKQYNRFRYIINAALGPFVIFFTLTGFVFNPMSPYFMATVGVSFITTLGFFLSLDAKQEPVGRMKTVVKTLGIICCLTWIWLLSDILVSLFKSFHNLFNYHYAMMAIGAISFLAWIPLTVGSLKAIRMTKAMPTYSPVLFNGLFIFGVTTLVYSFNTNKERLKFQIYPFKKNMMAVYLFVYMVAILASVLLTFFMIRLKAYRYNSTLGIALAFVYCLLVFYTLVDATVL